MSKQSDIANLEKKKKAIEEKISMLKNNNVPTPLENIDWRSVVDTCNSIISDLNENGYMDDDASHYIYEEVMMAVYGKNIFDWINRREDLND